MGRWNPAVLLDEAMQHLPDDKLAASVRALEDRDLANMVRQDPTLRRFVLMTVLDSLQEAGAAAGREHAVAKARARASGNGSRKSDAPSPEPGSKADAVLEAVKAAGDEGTSCKSLEGTVGLRQTSVSKYLRDLVAAGSIRKEGNARATRYFAA